MIFNGRKIEYINPIYTAAIEITFSDFSYFIGTEVLSNFDTPFSLIMKFDKIGVIIGQIIKIQAFHMITSKADSNAIYTSSRLIIIYLLILNKCNDLLILMMNDL